ncbi:ADL165Cp [Eremothecium gossypii ATCC 10895]|uniref:ADL165Cp n=1 Tax=Eremothecium gossypii (strain ATCC 10895 / CBS 109.51 / FGSC 9923 / NRRL Y-1056) TaxID=284811 RepID=Q75AT5_EREGS|nr:ADL165Cp [Eremothecium gossypii ATCC 10895]AAS51755.2 ADL165Cp [Eremothecium gossypii ATCC 10895]AEY96052.1 FADL165Cp [Eremothecium gossypii FDAG1]
MSKSSKVHIGVRSFWGTLAMEARGWLRGNSAMEYTPPPSYNSIDLESQGKSGAIPAGLNPIILSCALWILTTTLAGLVLYYERAGTPAVLGSMIACLVAILCIVFHINKLLKDNSRWLWTCLSYFPVLQLFICTLLFFSNRGLAYWVTVAAFSAVLMGTVLLYCSYQSQEDWDQDTLWEQKNQIPLYAAPLMAIAALHITGLVQLQWIYRAYFIYLSVLLSLTTKHVYLNTDVRSVLSSNGRINAIMLFMFLSLSVI